LVAKFLAVQKMGASTNTLAQLPPRLSEIAAEIGQEQTANLAAAFGGQKVKFPAASVLPADHPVRKVLDSAAAEALHQMFRGERVLIPSGAAFYRQQQVLISLRAGMNPQAIADQLQVTPRAIEHIRCLLIAANLSPFPLAQPCA
jgi:hypothetical protein